MADELLHNIVGEGEPARDGEMARYEAQEPQDGEEARPAAIDARQAAQHAEILISHEGDWDNRGGAERGHGRDATAGRADGGACQPVQRQKQLPLGQRQHLARVQMSRWCCLSRATPSASSRRSLNIARISAAAAAPRDILGR